MIPVESAAHVPATERAFGQHRRGALFVIPSRGVVSAGPQALWIEAAWWAEAARRRFGDAWLVTPNGVLTAEQARAAASRTPGRAGRRARWRRLVPRVAATARKDAIEVVRAARFHRAALEGPWDDVHLAFVWQHHQLFHWAGFAAAQRFAAPLVLFVDAPLAWEAEKWGVRRPGWKWFIERFGEYPQLRRADLVACVSEEVAGEVAARGVSERRILVTPCSVDTGVFRPSTDSTAIRREYGFENSVVVGWVGSFRRFHGVELILRAFAQRQDALPNAALMLVGDGLERERMECLARELGIRRIRFTGMVSHERVPAHLAAMDIAVVADPAIAGFHYSPLKLKEYMACSCAVIAPDSGQPARWLRNGQDALVIPAGNHVELAEALQRLYQDEALRRRLSGAARRRVEQEGSWDSQVERVALALDALRAAENRARGHRSH
jgi:glycosyltransferase involved in cell wall biosynthesis